MRRDRRLIHKLVLVAYHPAKFSARGSFPLKKLKSDDHFDPPFSLMAVGGNSETKTKEMKGKNMNPLTQFKKLPILPILLVLGCSALPASAGTTQVSGIGVFNNACQPPAGSPPADLGDYPPIDLSGSLDGCWYTYVSNRSSTRAARIKRREPRSSSAA